jgi:hypothetical protein
MLLFLKTCNQHVQPTPLAKQHLWQQMQTNIEVCKGFQVWHYTKTCKTPKTIKYNKNLPIDNTSHITTMVVVNF